MNFKRNVITIVGLFIFVVGVCVAAESNCVTTRAVFDIGSGSTRIVVAKVDSCRNKLVEVLRTGKEAVLYKVDLDASTTMTFSKKIIEEGGAKIKKLLTLASDVHKENIRAVATAAFREANNSRDAVEYIKKATGVEIRILSQQDEAIVGYMAVLSSGKELDENSVIWDIGAASMQLIYKKNDYETYLGSMASVPFKNEIIRRILGKDPRTTTTPNPLGKLAHDAVVLARNFAKNTLPPNFIFKTPPKVFGVGGVHFHSVAEKCELKERYSVSMLEKCLEKRSNFTDAQLGEPEYAATEVSNLALVLGFMQAMHFDEVVPINVNNAHGVFIYSKLW